MSRRGLAAQPGANLLDRSAIEAGRYQLVETALQDGLVQFGQHEHAFARHDLDAKVWLELGPMEHAARILAREKWQQRVQDAALRRHPAPEGHAVHSVHVGAGSSTKRSRSTAAPATAMAAAAAAATAGDGQIAAHAAQLLLGKLRG